MDTKSIVDALVAAVQDAPQKAQDLISDPKGAIARISGATSGYDLAEVVQQTLARLAEAGIDLSSVDLSKLDLSQIDVSKLDLGALQDAASKLNIDLTKLDFSKIDLGAAVQGLFGGLAGGLGGLFGRK